MLKSDKIWVFNLARQNVPIIQAGIESVTGLFLEGRVQASIVYGIVETESRVAGYYESVEVGDHGVYRRVTGGSTAHLAAGDAYIGLLFASESLGEVAEVAERMSGCLGGGVWGVTRIGPREVAAGVIELFGAHELTNVIDCARPLVGVKGVRVVKAEPPSSVGRIAKAYAEPSWRYYPGIRSLPHRGLVFRDDYWVGIGLSLYKDRYVSLARVEGVFYAAPPAEPFSLVANLQGMPVGDQLLLMLEARASTQMELHGVEPGDFVKAFVRAAGLNDE